MRFYDRLLNEDERVIKVIRSQPIAFAWSIFFSLLLICSAAFFMVPLFGIGRIGFSVFGFLLVVGIFLGIRVIVMAKYNSFIITDTRLIDWDQRGLFDQEISEISLDEIYDVSYRIKGPVNTAMNVGSIRVQSQDGEIVFVLHGVKYPEEAQRFINDVRRDLE